MMNYPQQPMGGMQSMMGHQGMGMMHPQGVAPSPFAPHFSPAGMVTLDPDLYPGMVTLDPGNPYPAYPHGPGFCHHQAPMPRPQVEAPRTCTCPVTYVVKKGDSVYKIAQKFGTSMQAIILANNLSNPDLIFPGQVLVIPNV